MNLLDSETPPSSPILGYSGGNDDQTAITDSGVVYCLNCKSTPKANDYSFHPDGYIMRREVICAVDNFSRTDDHRGDKIARKGRLIKCFGYLLDPLEQDQVKNMIRICRKNIDTLEFLSESPNHVPLYFESSSHVPNNDPDDDPWTLRQQACYFLNLIVRHLTYYRTVWKPVVLESMFLGKKKTLPSVKDWSSQLKIHCGFCRGNECMAAIYHFFHIQLEVRWSLLLIFGVTPSMIQWLFSDLIHLSCHKYNSEQDAALDEKQPFNCVCIKEMWTMCRLLIDELKPEGKIFWDFLSEALQKFESPDAFFPIWFTSHLSPIVDYSPAGVFCPGLGKLKNGTNGYKFVQVAYKTWLSKGGKPIEVLKLTFKFFEHWGGDSDILNCLWSQWAPRIDKGNQVLNYDSYDVENWLNILSQICEESCDSHASQESRDQFGAKACRSVLLSSHQHYLGSNNDPFNDFVRLAVTYASSCSEKDMQRLKASIFMKLTGKADSSTFGEIGVIRGCTLLLALMSKMSTVQNAVSLAERLQSIFNCDRGKHSPGRWRIILRAYSLMVIFLLKKKMKVDANSGVWKKYIQIVDELLSQSSSAGLDPTTRKDLSMIYINFLRCIPKHTPALCDNFHLGRENLISSNLSMWLSNCDANYSGRTIGALVQLTDWILKWVSSSEIGFRPSDHSTGSLEAKNIFLKISEKCLPNLRSFVGASKNRIPYTDVKPVAFLAGNLTLLMKFYGKKEFVTQFDFFALDDKTCPLVSQHYIETLAKEGFFIDGTSLVKWTQAWLRLILLDCTVPGELTSMVLGGGFDSTSNSELLKKFCERQDNWGKETMQKIVESVMGLPNRIMDGSLLKDQDQERSAIESEKIIESVISCCSTIFCSVKFQWLYVKGDMKSYVLQFLNTLVPSCWPGLPPWETLPKAVMNALEKNLFKIFQTLVDYSGNPEDKFLQRKFKDLVVFAFLGFVKEHENINIEEHPAFRIFKYSEDKNVTQILNNILPRVIAGEDVVKDAKLSQRFLNVAQLFAVKRPSFSVRVLAGIIRLFVLQGNNDVNGVLSRKCMLIIIQCCRIGCTPQFKSDVVDAFEEILKKDFSFKSRQIFGLCGCIAKSGNEGAKKFLKFEIIPLLKSHIEIVEMKRATGCDRSLRGPLQVLENNLAHVTC